MLKQKLKFKSNLKVAAGVLTICAVLVSATVYSAFAHADQFDDRIRTLQALNNKKQAVSDDLAAQANSYAQAINALQQRINSLQEQITSTQHQMAQVKTKIKQAQIELDHEKLVLGENIKAMYMEGQVSTLEILASSRDLSEFVDKEQTRSIVQQKVKDTLTKVNQLKVQLEQKQRLLEGLMSDLQAQQTKLSNDQSQKTKMLDYTESQKASYDHQIRTNNARISSLRAQQRAANASLGGQVVAGDPGHGGYPAVWDHAAQDSMIDSWGMFNRECVSYTAWKVYQTFGHMPYWGGHGNANQWPASARSAGIPTGSTPRVHSVAISMGGYYGHAMWVEAVSGHQIYVSQYNFDLAGHYSEMWVNGSNFTYIYFSN
jgi:peptidoglycan hydrolase CwlO-like protein